MPPCRRIKELRHSRGASACSSWKTTLAEQYEHRRALLGHDDIEIDAMPERARRR